MQSKMTALTLLCAFFGLLIFKNPAMNGAKAGLILWYRFILPSLLPFMVLIQLIQKTDTLSMITRKTGLLMRRFPGVSAYGSFAVTAGFICGYPMGAKVTADLVSAKKISLQEGQYLLSFCNNLSPMFILGVLFQNYIPEAKLHLPFFLIFVLSPLICSQIFRPYYMSDSNVLYESSRNAVSQSSGDRKSFAHLLDESLISSADAVIRIGLYMMLSTLILYIFLESPSQSSLPRLTLLSTIEITSGLALLDSLPFAFPIHYVLLLALTSFGGFCAVLQTLTMIQHTRLRIFPYIIQKLITAGVTSLLAFLYLYFIY